MHREPLVEVPGLLPWPMHSLHCIIPSAPASASRVCPPPTPPSLFAGPHFGSFECYFHNPTSPECDRKINGIWKSSDKAWRSSIFFDANRVTAQMRVKPDMLDLLASDEPYIVVSPRLLHHPWNSTLVPTYEHDSYSTPWPLLHSLFSTGQYPPCESSVHSCPCYTPPCRGPCYTLALAILSPLMHHSLGTVMIEALCTLQLFFFFFTA